MKRANPEAVKFKDPEFDDSLNGHVFYLDCVIKTARSAEERKALYQATMDIESNGEDIIKKTLELFRAQRLVKSQQISEKKAKVEYPEGCDNSPGIREADAEKMRLDDDAELHQLEALIVEVKDFIKTIPSNKRSVSLMFSRSSGYC